LADRLDAFRCHIEERISDGVRPVRLLVDYADADRAGATADIVRYWERTAPYRDPQVERLIEAAADVHEVLPDGWRVAVGDVIDLTGPGDDEPEGGMWPCDGDRWAWIVGWGEDHEAEGYADSARDAALAALDALGVDPSGS
jgi:hypothetical protein